MKKLTFKKSGKELKESISSRIHELIDITSAVQ